MLLQEQHCTMITNGLGVNETVIFGCEVSTA